MCGRAQAHEALSLPIASSSNTLLTFHSLCRFDLSICFHPNCPVEETRSCHVYVCGGGKRRGGKGAWESEWRWDCEGPSPFPLLWEAQ